MGYPFSYVSELPESIFRVASHTAEYSNSGSGLPGSQVMPITASQSENQFHSTQCAKREHVLEWNSQVLLPDSHFEDPVVR